MRVINFFMILLIILCVSSCYFSKHLCFEMPREGIGFRSNFIGNYNPIVSSIDISMHNGDVYEIELVAESLINLSVLDEEEFMHSEGIQMYLVPKSKKEIVHITGVSDSDSKVLVISETEIHFLDADISVRGVGVKKATIFLRSDGIDLFMKEHKGSWRKIGTKTK